MQKLTDIELLKFWLDAELHGNQIWIYIILINIVDDLWLKIALIVFATYNFFYSFSRLAVIANQDPDYLRAVKK